MVARILRAFAYLYHLVFALYLLGVVFVATTSQSILTMPFLPWAGDSLIKWLTGGAIIGIISIVLAVTGIFRFLFPLWAFGMLAMLVRGFLLQPYAFDDKTSFVQILWLIGGALLAFLASLTLFFVKSKRRA